MVTLAPDSPASTLKCWDYSPGYHTQISYGILKSSLLLVQALTHKIKTGNRYSQESLEPSRFDEKHKTRSIPSGLSPCEHSLADRRIHGKQQLLGSTPLLTLACSVTLASGQATVSSFPPLQN